MWSQAKVLGFLDLAGDWDPSLLFVLGSAVGVTAIGFRLILRRRRPLLGTAFEAPPAERIAPSLLIGSAIFGVGWGLSGFCPGPGIAALARISPDALLFVAAFAVGSLVYRFGIRVREATPGP